MNINSIIEEEIKNLLKENFDFNNIPDDIKNLLDGYDLFMNFDWNKKQDEFNDDVKGYDGEGFKNWFNNHKSEQFALKINELISKVRKDIILTHKKNITDKKLKYFEELIKPVLGNDVLLPALSKYEEIALLDPNATIEDIERGFREAKNIIDSEGSIDFNKVEPSEIFKGGDISLPAFERYAQKNPDYKGVFNDWKTLFDQSIDYSLEDLYTDQVVSLNNLKKLYNYLINIKKQLK